MKYDFILIITPYFLISLLTIINGNLIKDIVKKDIGDTDNLGTLFSHFSVGEDETLRIFMGSEEGGLNREQ